MGSFNRLMMGLQNQLTIYAPICWKPPERISLLEPVIEADFVELAILTPEADLWCADIWLRMDCGGICLLEWWLEGIMGGLQDDAAFELGYCSDGFENC